MTGRGCLSETERQIIDGMISDVRRHGEIAKIARRLKRPLNTIWCYVILNGLRSIKPSTRSGPYMRSGKIVRPFINSEDIFIEEKRKSGFSYAAIARAITEHFGIERAPNSIRNRLISMASTEIDR
ncbi:MAG: hypothetical protein POG24_05445 [Acidocella sp.]|nr:hypothetical protein [Acidocella sp.]